MTDDRDQQRLFKSVAAQLGELIDNLPAELRPDLAGDEGREALAKTLRIDEDGNVAFGTPTHGFYRADGRAWCWERDPGPKGTEVVEYVAGVAVSRSLVSQPPELN